MYRAKDKDGKEIKGGYCGEHHGLHYLVPVDAVVVPDSVTVDEIECIGIPDPSTIAVGTGRKDKHGVEIFGSQGEFQGGDRIRGTVDGELHEWDIEWEETEGYMGWPLGNDNDELEIIERTE